MTWPSVDRCDERSGGSSITVTRDDQHYTQTAECRLRPQALMAVK